MDEGCELCDGLEGYWWINRFTIEEYFVITSNCILERSNRFLLLNIILFNSVSFRELGGDDASTKCADSARGSCAERGGGGPHGDCSPPPPLLNILRIYFIAIFRPFP